VSGTVALDELARRVAEHGPVAFLVTTGTDARSHVVSVAVSFDGETFAFAAGTTSTANVEANPAATLLWPGTGGPYALIVDGRARRGDDGLVLDPTRAVLHRLAGASADLPSCVRIEPDA